MVNVVTKRCGHPDCNKKPSFGVGGGKKTAELCAKHKQDGMVNVLNSRMQPPRLQQAAVIRRGRGQGGGALRWTRLHHVAVVRRGRYEDGGVLR